MESEEDGTMKQSNEQCGEMTFLVNESHSVSGNNDNGHCNIDCNVTKQKSGDFAVSMQQAKTKTLIYGLSETPPFHMTIFFAMQQCLISINTSLAVSILVSEVVCASHDDVIKTQIISTTMMMAGIATFMMTTFGIRLPIFQGPTVIYIINLAALADDAEWSCPKLFRDVLENGDNTTSVLMADLGNGTFVPLRSVIYNKIGQISGSLMMAGFVHFAIGATGLVGILTRFIGPLTIVPAIVLVGLNIFTVTVKFCETSWLAASVTAISCLTFSLLLSNRKTPIPFWNKQRGLHIFWYPLHQVFSILFGSIIGWTISGIMTSAGVFSTDVESIDFFARTDARSSVIGKSPWFTFPYPGRFGGLSFSTSAFINFLIITFLSIMDSIGDYSATARVAKVPPPPKYAFNRGIAVEGLMTMLSGSMGCCHGTVSHGEPIGIMGITKVTSRRVFQTTAVLYVLFACLGKLGAAFVTIPYSVLGGTQIATIGIFIGVVLSYLKMVNMNSTRNMSIVGISLLLGLMLPYWIKKRPSGINTGSDHLDAIISMFMSNPSFVGGVFACIMDNIFPGTRKDRGLVTNLTQSESSSNSTSLDFEEGPEVYRLPILRAYCLKSRFSKWIPFCERNETTNE